MIDRVQKYSWEILEPWDSYQNQKIVKMYEYDYKKLVEKCNKFEKELTDIHENIYKTIKENTEDVGRAKQQLHIEYKGKIESLEKQLKESSIIRKQLECIHEDGIFVDHEFWKKQKDELKRLNSINFFAIASVFGLLIAYIFNIRPL